MIGRCHHVVIDCPDPAVLADFYSALIGLPVTYRSHDWVVISADTTTSGFAFQRVSGHRPPEWPDPAHPQQFHLDVMVDEPALAEPQVLALGARLLDADRHVYADPAGHPFCLIPRPGWAPPVHGSEIAYSGAMDRESAQLWLDRYVGAWLSYDPEDIAQLFSEDVVYRYHPYDEPVVGRDAVVASWLGDPVAGDASTRDEPGTYEAAYSPVAVDGDVVVATGTSHYREAADGPVVRTYENCFVMRFDSSGRCRDFTEYYVRRP